MPKYTNKEEMATYADLEPHAVFSGPPLFFRVFLFVLALALLPALIVTFLIVAVYEIELGVSLSLVLGCLILFVILAAFLFVRNITRPIALLTAAIKRISMGDLKARIDLNQQDEFGNLSRFFNAMLERFNETQERNLAISRLKSQFVSVAAHQLRTPLSALKWTMRLLLDGDIGAISEEQKKILERGYVTNERMISLVNDMLEVSRIEEGKYGFSFQKVFIAEIVQNVVLEITPEAERQGVQVNVAIQVPKKLSLIGDPERLHAALMNLLDNALRYNHPGGKVALTLMRDAEFVKISVEDTGIGIPDTEADKIFSKFYRATNALKRETEGSGLGLFIVQNIVNRHGGSIEFASIENKGTSVSLTLPVRHVTTAL